MRHALIVLALGLLPTAPAAAAPQTCAAVHSSADIVPTSGPYCEMDLAAGTRDISLTWSPDATAGMWIYLEDAFTYVAIIHCEVIAGTVDRCDARGVRSFVVEASPVNGRVLHADFDSSVPVRSTLEIRSRHPVGCAGTYCPGAAHGSFGVRTELR